MSIKFRSKFSPFVCVGDYVECTDGPVTYRATIHFDDISTSSDVDCYSSRDVKRLERGEWWFGGVILSAYVGEVCVEPNAASLWALECNFRKNSNAYLLDTANELLSEAQDAARAALGRLVEAAGGVA